MLRAVFHIPYSASHIFYLFVSLLYTHCAFAVALRSSASILSTPDTPSLPFAWHSSSQGVLAEEWLRNAASRRGIRTEDFDCDRCPSVVEPVCSGTLTFPHRCYAVCQGLDIDYDGICRVSSGQQTATQSSVSVYESTGGKDDPVPDENEPPGWSGVAEEACAVSQDDMKAMIEDGYYFVGCVSENSSSILNNSQGQSGSILNTLDFNSSLMFHSVVVTASHYKYVKAVEVKLGDFFPGEDGDNTSFFQSGTFRGPDLEDDDSGSQDVNVQYTTQTVTPVDGNSTEPYESPGQDGEAGPDGNFEQGDPPEGSEGNRESGWGREVSRKQGELILDANNAGVSNGTGVSSGGEESKGSSCGNGRKLRGSRHGAAGAKQMKSVGSGAAREWSIAGVLPGLAAWISRRRGSGARGAEHTLYHTARHTTHSSTATSSSHDGVFDGDDQRNERVAARDGHRRERQTRESGFRVLKQLTRDTRSPVASTLKFPNWAIGKLTMTNKKGIIVECSGSFISPIDFITSAHCILNTTDNMFFLTGYVQPALSNGVQPFGKLEVQSANLLQAYVNMQGWTLSAVYFDVAVVRVNNPSGAWLPMQGTLSYTKRCNSQTETLRTCGYAEDVDQMSTQVCVDCPKLTTNFCQSNTANPNNIITAQTCFVNEGQSGSPLMVRTSGLVVGMLSGFGKNAQGGTISWFTPLDNYQLDYLLNFKWKVTLWSIQGQLAPFQQPLRTAPSAGPRRCIQGPSVPAAGIMPIVGKCVNVSTQKWTRRANGSDALRIRFSSTTFCLDVKGRSKSNGAKVVLQKCSSAAGWSQMWFYDFSKRLRNGNAPNLCLSTSTTATSTYLVLELCSTAARQQWTL